MEDFGGVNRRRISAHFDIFSTTRSPFGVAGALLDVGGGKKAEIYPSDGAKSEKVPPSRVPNGTQKTLKSGQRVQKLLENRVPMLSQHRDPKFIVFVVIWER